MKKFYLSGVIGLVLHGLALGQGPQSEFLEAKRLFREGNFQSAQSAFSSLYQDPSLGTYASFYAGLSSYELGEKEGALSIWRQILTKDPRWDQLSEVYYWMTLTNYEIEEYGEAIRLSQLWKTTGDETVHVELAEQFLARADMPTLRSLYVRNPNFAPLGRLLTRRLTEEDPTDIATIRELIEKFDLDPDEFSQITKENVRKDEYSVAVLFPFLFDGLEDPSATLNNRVVMELYQGMVLGQKELVKAGKPVKLYPFDTRRSAEVTRALLLNDGVKDADLIVGPLFPGPNAVVDSFAIAHQVNMVNPVSSNANVIGENPFSFLLKPSHRTQAQVLADYAADNYGDRGALVYYALNNQDTTFASAYRQRLEERGVEIAQYRAVDIKSSKTLLDSLIEKDDIFIENLVQLDTMRDDPTRIIKSRKPKPNIPEERDYLLPTGRFPGDSSVYYETRYQILQNSIGHIAVIARDNSVINSFIGVVETRADTMGLVGYGNWTELSAVDFDQLERLNVRLALPEFIDKKTARYELLFRRVQQSCECVPSIYHFLGFESIVFLGKMLHKHGKYFQNGWIAEDVVPGRVLTGYEFGLYRDNQVVPLVGLNNLELQSVPIEEDDKE